MVSSHQVAHASRWTTHALTLGAMLGAAACQDYSLGPKPEDDPILLGNPDSDEPADTDVPESGPRFPELTWSPPQIDFGYVEEGTEVSADVVVSNLGDETARLDDLTTTGSPTFGWSADLAPFLVAPGASEVITVTFRSDATDSLGELSFTTNDDYVPLGSVLLQGTGRNPALVATPDPLVFGDVELGATGLATLTFSNPGNAPVSLSAIQLDDAAFALPGLTLPLVLAAGEEVEVDATFAPTVEGDATATLTLTSDARLPAAPVTFLARGVAGAPIVDCRADPPIVTSLGGSATFVGRDSTDPGGSPLTWAWTMTSVPAGSAVPLRTGSTPDVGPITPDVAGVYTAELVVTNGAGNQAGPCVASFTYASLPGLQVTPDPLAFGAQVPRTDTVRSLTARNTGNTVVRLSGATSSDPRFVPATVTPGALPPGASTSLPVTFTPDALGAFQATLTVTSDVPAVSVTATGSGAADPPVASCAALPPVVSTVGGTTALIGSGSTDPQGRPLTYAWSLTGVPMGSGVNLNGLGTGADRGPITPDRAGTYTARLVVTNDLGLASAPCTTSFTALEVRSLELAPSPLDFGDRPVDSATVRPLRMRNAGNTDVVVTGATSSQSAFAVTPIAPIRLAPGDTTSVSITFTPDALGAFSGTLTAVSDLPASPFVAVLGQGVAEAPTAVCDAVPDQLTTLGDGTTLVGSGSSDPQGRPLTYAWSLTQRPAGSSLTLGGTGTGPNRTPVVPDVQGTYTARLVVTNDLGLASAPCTTSFTLTVIPDPPIDDCDGVEDAVYVLERDNDGLYLFDPDTLALTFLGELDCSIFGSPGSMAIARNGVAYVRWSDLTLYEVDLATLDCTETPYVDRGFGAFGMGYATDAAGTWVDQMYVANGSQIGVMNTNTWRITNLSNGAITSQSELTGNSAGELWAFLPLERKLQQRAIPSGASLSSITLPGFPAPANIDTFAFATWGGEFWLFVRTYGVGNSSDVYRVTPSGTLTMEVRRLGIDIVGAGVSTCASSP